MDYIGKISIRASKKERRKKAVLTAGLFFIAIVVIIEIFFSLYVVFAFVIPFLYLLSLRLRIGNDWYVKDVIIRIETGENEYQLTVFNSVYKKNILCSCKYLITKGTKIQAIYNKSLGQLALTYNSKIIYFVNETVIDIDNMDKQRSVYLLLTLDDAQALAGSLGLLVKLI